jgi:hypothetical protein
MWPYISAASSAAEKTGVCHEEERGTNQISAKIMRKTRATGATSWRQTLATRAG